MRIFTIALGSIALAGIALSIVAAAALVALHLVGVWGSAPLESKLIAWLWLFIVSVCFLAIAGALHPSSPRQQEVGMTGAANRDDMWPYPNLVWASPLVGAWLGAAFAEFVSPASMVPDSLRFKYVAAGTLIGALLGALGLAYVSYAKPGLLRRLSGVGNARLVPVSLLLLILVVIRLLEAGLGDMLGW